MNLPRVLSLLMALLLGGIGVVPLQGQATDPGAIQDAEMERRQLLKAADQIEILVHRVEAMHKDLTEAQTKLKDLEAAQQALKAGLEADRQAHRKERDALLDEVSKLLAESHGSPPEQSGVAASSDEGYEHIVKKGQSLWTIAKAFQDQGIAVTVEDIRRANQLGTSDVLQVGQRLFIPKTK